MTFKLINCPFNWHYFWWKTLFLPEALTFWPREGALFSSHLPPHLVCTLSFLFYPSDLFCTCFSLPSLCSSLYISSSSFHSPVLSPFSSSFFSFNTIYQNLIMTFVCTCVWVGVFFLLPSLNLHSGWLFARARSCSQPMDRLTACRHGDPTTCQVTVATTEEGTGPMAIDTYPPTRVASVVRDLHPWFLFKTSLLNSVFLSFLSDVQIVSAHRYMTL